MTRFFSFGLFILTLIGTDKTAHAEEIKAPIVVELFTSQSCSS